MLIKYTPAIIHKLGSPIWQRIMHDIFLVRSWYVFLGCVTVRGTLKCSFLFHHSLLSLFYLLLPVTPYKPVISLRCPLKVEINVILITFFGWGFWSAHHTFIYWSPFKKLLSQPAQSGFFCWSCVSTWRFILVIRDNFHGNLLNILRFFSLDQHY